MPIFGDQVSRIVDDVFDRLDVFSRPAENPPVKDIGIRKDPLVNEFGISVRRFDRIQSDLFAVVEVPCTFWVVM